MTTQTSPTDNERLARLEGIGEQMNERLNAMDGRFDSIERRFESVDARFDSIERIVAEMNTAMREGFDRIHQELRSQRNNFLTALIITWASMLGGFVAIFVGILTLNS